MQAEVEDEPPPAPLDTYTEPAILLPVSDTPSTSASELGSGSGTGSESDSDEDPKLQLVKAAGINARKSVDGGRRISVGGKPVTGMTSERSRVAFNVDEPEKKKVDDGKVIKVGGASTSTLPWPSVA